MRQDSIFIGKGRSTAEINLGKVLRLQILQEKGNKSESQGRMGKDMRQEEIGQGNALQGKAKGFPCRFWCGHVPK